MNKRRFLGQSLSKLGLLPILRYLDRQNPCLKLLAYHRVVDIDKSNYPFDDNLIDASLNMFDCQMSYLAKHYNVLPLSEAYTAFQNGDKDVVAVTFDDGFDDLYYNIYPILKRYGISATMFLTTGLIGTKDTLWSEQVVYSIKTKIGNHFCLPEVFGDTSIRISPENVSDLIDKVLAYFKRIPDVKRQVLLKDLKDALGMIDREFQTSESRMLDWEMVHEMSDYGIEFGSHSVSHGVLANLEEAEIERELYESKLSIEKVTGKGCRTIAYPVGGISSFNSVVLNYVAKLDYELGCSYLSGVNYSNSLRKFELRRLHIDHSVDFDWFKSIVANPSLCASDFGLR